VCDEGEAHRLSETPEIYIFRKRALKHLSSRNNAMHVVQDYPLKPASLRVLNRVQGNAPEGSEALTEFPMPTAPRLAPVMLRWIESHQVGRQ